ncbi:MAG TPA: alkaline phosphatase family protein [Candidatus Binataceae bacterium]|jgi:phospholipase C|nr:alkaline phosphatase family protein [Candidatus Binataceae bacterium]
MRSKRRVTAALGAAALVLSSTMPAAVRAQDWEYVSPSYQRQGQLSAPQLASANVIKHVVVIFQENVSFDHYFATYPNARNLAGESTFVAAPGTPDVNGLTPDLIAFNPNSTKPFRLSRAQAATCDQDHDYGPEQLAFDFGLMDKFPQNTGVGAPGCPDYGKGKGLVMGYYDGSTVTGLWNYVQSYAMSDNFYDTDFGPSTPGAINLISGQTHGASADPGVVVDGTVISDDDPAGDKCSGSSTFSMTGKNVGDLLNAKGITWGWFEGGFDLAIENPNGTTGCKRSHTSEVFTTPKVDYIPHHEPFQYYPQTANPLHKRPTSVAMIGKTDQANHQYDINDFFAAVNNGNMPAVSYLKASGYQDGHAGYSSPLDEQTFLVNTINFLQARPEWASTAILITWDDSDGWYDHQMGPIVSHSQIAQDALSGPGMCGTNAAINVQGRCGYGPRIPALAISAFSKVNFVDHTTTDQTSILRFVEDTFGLGRIGGGSFDAKAGSLNNMFDFKNPNPWKLLLDPTTGMVM